MHRRPRTDSPEGWDLWSSQESYSASLYLPPRLARQLRAEEDADRMLRAEAARAATTEETAVKGDSEGRIDESCSRELPSSGSHRRNANEVWRHEVLPESRKILKRLEDLRSGLYGTKESSEREISALGAALRHGTSRSVVRPSRWRIVLQHLSDEMPAFREAIEVFSRAFELSELSGAPARVPPVLLVGPPGVGKSYFCRRLSESLLCGTGWLGMDQPTAGSDLRGTDVHWSTARHGLLFELLALGDTANPVVVLDEIDKAPRRHGSGDIDVLAQLHAVLESETARHVADVSLGVNLDASLVMYVATANEIKSLGAPILSRFEVVQIGLPGVDERRSSAERIVSTSLRELGLNDVRVKAGSYVVLADFTPRVIRRAVERAVAQAVQRGRSELDATDFEVALGFGSPAIQLHRLH